MTGGLIPSGMIMLDSREFNNRFVYPLVEIVNILFHLSAILLYLKILKTIRYGYGIVLEMIILIF
jgi:hypothetical protein